MPESVEVIDDDSVRIIRMNRPEKKNALTQPMYATMTAALSEAGKSDAIRCIMFAGAPGAFSAGADISEFLESAKTGALRPKTIEFLNALAVSEKPMVAAVGGLAVGIGTTLLLHCDHVVAASGTMFSTPFVRLGLIPEAASSLLAPLRIGASRLDAASGMRPKRVNGVENLASVDAMT